ncbi:hypothetical protein HK103_004472 [Boothiomyces macroporosus]|uniref:Phospholipid scramblase n=1 Tax=Boothiomyces macroporosus TaxID=261099 RepID=A0AAD5Y5T8_9FUNG|nr:hypothetical protein HK103_004472 [Boothiomyces macroporosus]
MNRFITQLRVFTSRRVIKKPIIKRPAVESTLQTTLVQPAEPQLPAELPSNYLRPVELPDVKTIIPRESPESFIFKHNCLVVGRQLEIMNVILGYEQANKYSLNTIDGQNVGIICEEESTFKSAILRQLFRTRREYNADLLDLNGNLIKRPFKWFLNSTIKIYYKDEEIGFVKSDWHLWRRRYDLFVQNEQFARIDMGLWAWDFEARDNEEHKISDINRNFMDMGKYIVHYDATVDTLAKISLDQRAVLLACAMSIDIDYFSRHSNTHSPGMMPIVATGEAGTPPPPVATPAPVPDVGSGIPNVAHIPLETGAGIPNIGSTPDMTSNIPNMGSTPFGDGKNQWGDDAFLSDEQANIASEGFESASEEGTNLLGKLWDFFNND